jgi:hypothetical protein
MAICHRFDFLGGQLWDGDQPAGLSKRTPETPHVGGKVQEQGCNAQGRPRVSAEAGIALQSCPVLGQGG